MKLSIVIPSYNDTKEHIDRCFNSILPQLGEEDDVVFVDDASTEQVAVFAKEAAKGRALVLRKKTNCGPGAARNTGVKYCKGDYVWYVDADDYIGTDSIKRIKEAIEKNGNPDAVGIPFVVVHPSGPSDKMESAKDYNEFVCGPVSPCLKVIKRSKIVSQPEGTIAEDTPWHFVQSNFCDTYGRVEGNEPCYIYDRTNNQSTTETAAFCASHCYSVEQYAREDILVKNGMKDRWVSDFLRNIANMYDCRRYLNKEVSMKAWASRFYYEYGNLMTGHLVH